MLFFENIWSRFSGFVARLWSYLVIITRWVIFRDRSMCPWELNSQMTTGNVSLTSSNFETKSSCTSALNSSMSSSVNCKISSQLTGNLATQMGSPVRNTIYC